MSTPRRDTSRHGRRIYPKIWINRMNRVINPWAIVVARYARRWSQQELADYIGVERSTVSNWERNRTFPTGQNADRLALFISRTNQDIRKGSLKPPPGFEALLKQAKEHQW